MVMRVTNQIQQINALRNIFQITEDLFLANQRVATGKRINKPSDDPLGMQDTLTLRSSIAQIQQFGRNIDNNRLFLNTADASLDSVGLAITRALELAQGALGATSGAQTRANVALEIQSILDQVIQEANTQVKGQFIFGGTNLLNPPYQANPFGLGAVYSGNAGSLQVEVGPNLTVAITRPGSDVFGTDMNPAVNVNTLLSDLNGGSGVALGSFNITDRAGNTSAITVFAGDTVNNGITAINAAVGINVTASLNASQTGLLLTDTSGTVLQSLTVTEAGGTTAQSLGILSQNDGNITGTNLNPVLTAATLISDLDAGSGLTLGQIDIVNGALAGVVDLSGATTVGDVLTAINGAGLNVTASINSQGNALQVVSNDPTTTAVISEVAGGETAALLGIGGGNVFTALDALREAMERNDADGILASFGNLNAALDTILASRAEYGALVRTMDTLEIGHDADEVSETAQMSAVEDADFVKAASDLVALQLALEATLNTTARVLQPSLLDFLR
ncbi:MAG: flagellar hook-associated protein FlgL [Nitrospinae bacterium]|nr:flagellar hook-associated protein FlgL [Nitrospinota bacterium]